MINWNSKAVNRGETTCNMAGLIHTKLTTDLGQRSDGKILNGRLLTSFCNSQLACLETRKWGVWVA